MREGCKRAAPRGILRSMTAVAMQDAPPPRWDRHDPLTEPGAHAARLAALPDDPAALAAAVRGWLVHADYLHLYGLGAAAIGNGSRTTLPVAERLDAVLALDPAPIAEPRAPSRRAVGTCRDHALVLCALLRARGRPARVRCGFATYLVPGRHEDHWVCEHWLHEERRWALADAQVDAEHRAALGIAFDTTDLPPGAFLTAAQAWRAIAGQGADPALFGHGTTAGRWFVEVNLARDLLALLGRPLSEWDRWREAPPEARRADAAGARRCERMAAAIDALAATRGDVAGPAVAPPPVPRWLSG